MFGTIEKPLPVNSSAVLSKRKETKVVPEGYAELCKELGISYNPNPDPSAVLIEKFKEFLIAKDWPIYNLYTVVKYMDKMAKRDGNGRGWEWIPVTEQDCTLYCDIGQPCREDRSSERRKITQVASDYFNRARSNYNKLIPVHALKKIKAIREEFGDKVFLAICDYTLAAHYVDVRREDPFLMAIINNGQLKQGVGRFVIDFWDEPGFGLDKQL